MTAFELTRKSRKTGDYLDMCNRCFKTIETEVEVHERFDLLGDNSVNFDTVDSRNDTSREETTTPTENNSTKKPVLVYDDDK